MRFSQTTQMVEIHVEPEYLVHESNPDESSYLWAYHVTIENHGHEPVQLLSRYWKITDGLGRTQEVRGEGVVGEQPRIEPGSSYEYTSGVPLETNSGFMGGAYDMVSDSGEAFSAAIPTFSLDGPDTGARLN